MDKRLAADGRGLHTTKISDNFAKLTEVSCDLYFLYIVHLSPMYVCQALYVAEKSSRDAVDLRAKLQVEIHSKVDKKHEESLRRVALEIKEDVPR